MTRAELVKIIEEYEVISTVQQYGVVFIAHPKRTLFEEIMENEPTTIAYNGRTGETFVDLRAALSKYDSDSLYNLDFLNRSFIPSVVFIHDLIVNSEFNKNTPEYEFLRHIRNGFSHGNRFHFIGDQPNNTASFENLIITKKLQGITVLHDFVFIGDVIKLIAFIKKDILAENVV